MKTTLAVSILLFFVSTAAHAISLKFEYRNGATAYVSSGKINTRLTKIRDFTGTRGYCKNEVYVVTNGKRARNPAYSRIRYGRTYCAATIPNWLTQNVCGFRSLQSIIRDDRGRYLGEVKFRPSRC